MTPRTDKEGSPAKEAANGKKQSARPSGMAPSASVVSRHGIGTVTRLGRGFSMSEVSAAGLPLETASRWGLLIDPRRRSRLEPNVNALRGWAGGTPPKAPKESELKKVEEEIVKVERVVIKEVRKEVTKARKTAKKVEKEVEAAVEKPKPRRRKKKAPRG